MDEMRDPTRDESTATDAAAQGGLADEPMPGDAGSAGYVGGAPLGEGTAESGGTGPGEGAGREWLGQLETMINDLATQAAPVVRQIGAKAAELAAIAGEKAGPAAQRAAELTGDAGQKLAEKAHQVAADLRRDTAATGQGMTGDGTTEPAMTEPAPSGEAAEGGPQV